MNTYYMQSPKSAIEHRKEDMTEAVREGTGNMASGTKLLCSDWTFLSPVLQEWDSFKKQLGFHHFWE